MVADPPHSVSPPPPATADRLSALRWALAPAASPALTVALAVAIAASAFIADGGLRLEPTSRVMIAWILGAGALAATAVLLSARAPSVPLHGMGLLAAMGLLVGVTAASISWSVAPATSWEEANRTLGYLAVVVAGVALARLVPHRWPSLLQAVGLAAVLVCGWALLTKVFPAALAPEETFARLREPFGYWNAVGGMAALGMPPLLWLAARRSGHAAVNALAWPGMTVLLVALMLSYSRGALLALVVGLVLWFIVTPVRLRGALALAAAILASAAVLAWTFSQQALTSDRVLLPVRADAGRELGALLVLVLAGMLVAGLLVGFAADRRPPSERARRLTGRVLIAGLALLPILAVLALATAPGGVRGQVSENWAQLTDPEAETPANTPGRLTQTSSVRARYWREALAVHEASPWLGAGAGGYVTARTLVRTGSLLEVRHAHGYVVQTLADLGWLGIGASLVALGAWLVAAVRTIGLRPRLRGLPWDSERVGMATMGAVVVVYGVHSLLDFTWFIPGMTVPALLTAGWMAGARPLRARLLVPVPATPEAAAVAARPAQDALDPLDAASGRRRWPLGWRPQRWRPAAALGILAVSLTAAWAVLQPVSSARASDAAIARMEQGRFDEAAALARLAADRNPLAVQPRWDIARIELARQRPDAARVALERAVRLEPANAETWRRLGRFRLNVADDPRAALEAFEIAYYLDPQAPRSASDVLEARRTLEAGDGG